MVTYFWKYLAAGWTDQFDERTLVTCENNTLEHHSNVYTKK